MLRCAQSKLIYPLLYYGVIYLTGVNPAGDARDTSPNILVGGTSTGISPQYYYVLSDIVDQYWPIFSVFLVCMLQLLDKEKLYI